MPNSLHSLTVLDAKDVQFLNPHRSLRWCQELLAKAKATAGAGAALVKHLAAFLAVDDADLIAVLQPRFVL